MLRRHRTWFALLASAAFAAVAISACGGETTPEKDATLTFGCYIGECVPAAQDGDVGDASDASSEEGPSDAADAADRD